LASGITKTIVYVDKGYHAMGKGIRPVDRDTARGL
jgi:enoyl-[acyl-carrier-protein] reductase (NADH)